MEKPKRCTRCKRTKAARLFRFRTERGHRRFSWCRACEKAYARAYGEANRDRLRTINKAWRRKHRARLKRLRKAWAFKNRKRIAKVVCNNKLVVRYRITLPEYERMVRAQRGLCKICEKKPKRALNVDHDHATGAVRGLLCGPCNRGIGHLQDDPALLKKATQYLELCQNQRR